MHTHSAGAALYGVMGDPVRHSLSPLIHNTWLQALGLEAVYVGLPVRADDLAVVVPQLGKMGVKGVNLTIPHKQAILPLLSHCDPTAQAIGAVNTVQVTEEGLHGYNTDAYGFLKPLQQQLGMSELANQRCVVFGAGGAAAAVVYALHQAGVTQLTLVNRTVERAQALIDHLHVPYAVLPLSEADAALDGATVVVNTTSCGLSGKNPLAIDLSRTAAQALVYDIVYTPLETPLLAQAQALGRRCQDGLDMLIYQAEKAFSLWFAQTPDVALVRRQLLQQLGKA